MADTQYSETINQIAKNLMAHGYAKTTQQAYVMARNMISQQAVATTTVQRKPTTVAPGWSEPKWTKPLSDAVSAVKEQEQKMQAPATTLVNTAVSAAVSEPLQPAKPEQETFAASSSLTSAMPNTSDLGLPQDKPLRELYPQLDEVNAKKSAQDLLDEVEEHPVEVSVYESGAAEHETGEDTSCDPHYNSEPTVYSTEESAVLESAEHPSEAVEVEQNAAAVDEPEPEADDPVEEEQQQYAQEPEPMQQEQPSEPTPAEPQATPAAEEKPQRQENPHVDLSKIFNFGGK